MHVGNSNQKHVYHMRGEVLQEVEEEKDVGVLIHKSMKPARHCRKAANTGMGVLNQIRRNFHFRDRHVFVRLYKQYVRPHLEFATAAWSPWHKQDIDVLEEVQKRAVKMVSGLRGESYEDKCKELGLESLEKRRYNQDMVQTFKLVRRIDKLSPTKVLRQRQGDIHTRTAEDPYYLRQDRARLDIRKNFFTQRVCSKWNGIGTEIKEKSTSCFKLAVKENPVPGGMPED